MILRLPKYFILALLTFLLGIQTTYAKTVLVPPQTQVSFSIEQSQSLQSLEKDVPPNIGFLKEKAKFVIFEGVSAQNQYKFSEYFVEDLAEAVGTLQLMELIFVL